MLTAKEARQKVEENRGDRINYYIEIAEKAINKAIGEGKCYTGMDCPLLRNELDILENQLKSFGYGVYECGIFINGGAQIKIRWWKEDTGERD